MQLGIRLHDVEKGTIEHRAKIASEQGFKCAHIALKKLISEYSVDDAALTPGLAMYLKKVFAANDLDIAVLGNYLNLLHPDADELKKITHRYEAHLRFASILGCGVVGTETGCPNAEYKHVPECRDKDTLDLFIKNLKPVVKCAEDYGVIMAIEPLAKHSVYCPKAARYVLDEIASPNLQIIFDPVNLLDINNYEDRDAIIGEAMELLGEDIAMVHLKDFAVENNDLKSMACGLGMMKYDEILKFIKEKKPYAHATLEDTVPENAVATKELIQSIYDRV